MTNLKNINKIDDYFEKVKKELDIFEEAYEAGFLGLLRPQLVYLYSTIDALAYATFSNIRGNKKRFIKFCEEYINIDAVSSEDIYDNRSGVVHNLTCNNEYKQNGNKPQKRILYIYGNKTEYHYYKEVLKKWMIKNPDPVLPNKVDLENSIKDIKTTKSEEGYIFLNIKDLSRSIKNAIDELKKNSNTQKQLQSKLDVYIDSVFPPQIT